MKQAEMGLQAAEEAVNRAEEEVTSLAAAAIDSSNNIQFHLQGVGEPYLQQARTHLEEKKSLYWRARVNFQEAERGLQMQGEVENA